MTNKSLQVQEREGRTELIVPHLDSELTFIYPPVEGSYVQCAEQIQEQGLIQPTFGEIVSLAYAAWQNPNEEHSKEIINRLNRLSNKQVHHSWMRGFTGINYIADEGDNMQNGVYIQDNPLIKDKYGGKKISMDKEDLVKKLESKDPSVRFVPFNQRYFWNCFEITKTTRHLIEDPFIVALTGNEEQVRKIASIVNYCNAVPHLDYFTGARGWNGNNTSSVCVPSLEGYAQDYEFGIGAHDSDNHEIGFTFGKLKEGK